MRRSELLLRCTDTLCRAIVARERAGRRCGRRTRVESVGTRDRDERSQLASSPRATTSQVCNSARATSRAGARYIAAQGADTGNTRRTPLTRSGHSTLPKGYNSSWCSAVLYTSDSPHSVQEKPSLVPKPPPRLTPAPNVQGAGTPPHPEPHARHSRAIASTLGPNGLMRVEVARRPNGVWGRWWRRGGWEGCRAEADSNVLVIDIVGCE